MHARTSVAKRAFASGLVSCWTSSEAITVPSGLLFRARVSERYIGALKSPHAPSATHLPASHGPNPQVEGPGLGLLQSGIVRILINSDIPFSWWGPAELAKETAKRLFPVCADHVQCGDTGAADRSAVLDIYTYIGWYFCAGTKYQPAVGVWNKCCTG